MAARLAVLGLAAAAGFCAARYVQRHPAPKTVGLVDLSRYAGSWYEIARMPNVFQDRRDMHCVDVTATYSPLPDGTVKVLNRCRNSAQAGREVIVEGYARSASPGNDRLRVTFFWPAFGDYWVLGLDDDYRWSVVGTPNRKFLWILAREPRLSAEDYEKALAIAGREAFDITRLVRTAQTGAVSLVGAQGGMPGAMPGSAPGAAGL